MNSSYFTLYAGQEAIHGVVEYPAVFSGRAVVFLHGWGGYRTGPHDLFVKTAARLTELGCCCVRFDFRGKGYSGNLTTQATPTNMLSDLQLVIDYVRRELHCDRVSLAGICSGAKIAIYYAMNGSSPIEDVVEMSSAPLNPVHGQTKLALRHSSGQFMEYLGKAAHLQTWGKLFRGDLHLKQILHNVVSPLRRIGLRHKAQTPAAPGRKRPAFCNFRGRMLLIHGTKDPEAEVVTAHLQSILGKYDIDSDLRWIEGANHSFYSLTWEREIIDLVCDWFAAGTAVRPDAAAK